MTDGQVASPTPDAGTPPPPSSQPNGAPPESDGAGGGEPNGEHVTTLSGGRAEPSPNEGEPASNGNGADDADSWRQKYTLGDDARLKELSRYKSEEDWIKAGWEARKTAREKSAAKLPENPTPEQVADYRKEVGAPEKAEDYGLTSIEGHELSEVEKGMLGDFQEWAHGKHLPADMAQGIAEFYLQSRDADLQALNSLDLERKGEWDKELETTFGKDLDPTLKAAEAFIDQRFGDNEQAKVEILNARLPGGGRLGDSPAFVNMVVDLAMQNGFGDRIEANEIETSSGKPLAEQQMDIERLQATDRAKYDLPETQARLERIIELRTKRGEIDDFGRTIKRRAS